MDREVSLAAVLALAPSTLPFEVKNSLALSLGDRPAYEVGMMTGWDLMKHMLFAMPDPQYDNDQRHAAVQTLQQILRDNGFTATLAEQTLPGLLKLLTDKSDEREDVIRALAARENVQLATERTDGRWILVRSNGNIDIAETIRYVRRLNTGFWWFWRFMYGNRSMVILEEIPPQLEAGNSSTAQVIEAGSRSHYEQLVRNAAEAGGELFIQGNNNLRTDNGVYQDLSVYGGNNKISGIVVTGEGFIQGNNNEIFPILPPGVEIEVRGSNNAIMPQRMSWQEIAEHLGLV